MCSDCKSLTLATDPKDDSKLELWLPHNEDDERAGHIWIHIENDEPGAEYSEASLMLSPEEQDQLISWIQERRRERAGEEK